MSHSFAKLLLRNPLRLFSLLQGWLIGWRFVDEASDALPVLLETPGLAVVFKKKKTGRVIINGKLVIEKRGARPPVGDVVIEVYDGATLVIHGTVILGGGVHLLVGKGATLTIGSQVEGRTSISYGTEIIANENVKIGSGCMLSWDVLVMDTNIHPILEPPTQIHQPVVIGDHVWLGARSTVLKGVAVGAGAIVGTAAVVVKDVAAHTAVGGNPAKVLKEGVRWEE